MTENSEKLKNFIKNIYEETNIELHCINPITGKEIKDKKLNFENNMIKSFYINNGFNDYKFINVKNKMENEVIDWIDNKNNEKDFYISTNTFKIISKNDYSNYKKDKYVPFRRTSNLVYSSNVIFVDIDFYHIEKYKNKTVIEMYEIIKKEQSKFLKNLGCYCFICSGNGLYLFVKFDKTLYFLNDTYKDLWKNVSIGINYQLKEYGADFKCKGDFARVFRCPYTINYKHKKKKSYIIEDFDTSKCKSIKHLFALIETSLKIINDENNNKKENKKTKKNYIYTNKINNKENEIIFNNSYLIKCFIHERLLDLDILLNLRNNELTNCRYYYFLIYSNIYNLISKNSQKTYEVIKKINDNLLNPLDDSELIHIINYLNIKSLKFTNHTIKEYLNITDNELKYLTLSYTIEDKKMKHNLLQKKYYNKHKSGIMNNRKEKIKDILQKNIDLTNKELENITGLSIRQIQRYKKTLKDSSL